MKSKDGKKQVKSLKGKRKTSYEQGTDLEYELIDYLAYSKGTKELKDRVIFRTPASQTPADVWFVRRLYDNHQVGWSYIELYQCKSTRNLTPPYKDKKEIEKFYNYAMSIGAEPFWVERWKVNKNHYRRTIARILDETLGMILMVEDFSDVLKEAKKGHRA